LGLLSIYLLFKPLDIKQQEFVDVPLFELKDFTMYELDTNSLRTIMVGSAATRYSDRYTVKDMDYTDNSKVYVANMQADNGLYKEEFVTLDGNVVYTREDGLTFKTKKATYNKKTSDVVSDVGFIAYLNSNVVTGSYIKYNNLTKKIYSKDVAATYQLQERK